jgi:uncharacterized protein
MKSINFMSLKFRAFLLVVFVVAATLATASGAFAQWTAPANTGYVNDYAGVFDPVAKQTLENRLKALHDSTDAKIEIAVLTVRTTNGKPIFDYSLAIAREWKIGSKADDNPGVLLTVAIDDRKYFTQVSRDAEGDITDGLAGQYQRQYLVPAFKQGQYSKGINDTVEAYIRRFGETRGFDPATLQKTEIRQPAAPPVGGNTEKGGGSGGICVLCGCVIVIIVFIFIVSGLSGGAAAAARRSSWSGGGFGGSGGKRKGGTGSDIADAALPMIIGGILGSLGSGSSSGSSSSSDWGSSSGGGNDWGGFGGGGDFGGGGAGGDW